MYSFQNDFIFQTLGFFSLNTDKQVNVKFIDDYDKLYGYASRGRISALTAINDRYLQVTLNSEEPQSPNQTTRKVSRKSNCVIGAFVTSLSRCIIHKEIMRIDAVGGTVLKVASDALYYVLPKQSNDPVQYSQSFGKWKPIYPGPFLALAQLGVNNYASLSLDKEGQPVSQAKASGLVVSHFLTEKLDFALYSNMCDKLVSDTLFDFKKETFSNIRKKTDKKSLTFTKIRKRRSVFSRNLFFKRKLDERLKNRNKYVLLPYGFQQD